MLGGYGKRSEPTNGSLHLYDPVSEYVLCLEHFSRRRNESVDDTEGSEDGS